MKKKNKVVNKVVNKLEESRKKVVQNDCDIDEHEQYEEEKTYSEERIAMAEESISLDHFE